MFHPRAIRRAAPGRPDRGARWPAWLGDLGLLTALAGAASLTFLLAGVLLLTFNLTRMNEARSLGIEALELLDISRDLESSLLSAETGQRGFLLTGEERYLEPYTAAIGRIWDDFGVLERRVRDPAQRQSLARTRPLVAAKLDELARTVELRRTDPEAALAMVRSGEGQRLGEQIRAELGRFVMRERAILNERVALASARARAATWLAVACGALAMLAAGLSALGVLRRREERRLREQNERLEQEVAARTVRLEEANHELEAYAETISHDLRTPVRAIGGFAEALAEDLEGQLGAEQRDYLARISRAAERLDRLVGDILRYSRLAHQRVPLQAAALDEAVNAAIDQHHGEIAATGARVEVERPLPEVLGDRAALSLVIENLLSNALKFTAPGPAPEVRIRAETRPGGMVRLWVEDRGIGVTPAERDRIFRPFERLHGREAYPGTGIGLAIVRRVAERIGGSCGAEPRPGGGSRFWVDMRRPGDA
jgi:signal transduction histidine kinase